jgi:hypothetical protein
MILGPLTLGQIGVNGQMMRNVLKDKEETIKKVFLQMLLSLHFLF